jgi:heme/copper-type cytochrome/quinol oxidase subunit 2
MNTQTKSQKIVGTTVTVILILFAVWLVSPFFHITRLSYSHGEVYGYRLALGLTIMIIFVGKWAFDALAPQGLARNVSNAKAIALIALSLLIMGFIVFIVAQATVLYLKTAARESQQQTDINQRP